MSRITIHFVGRRAYHLDLIIRSSGFPDNSLCVSCNIRLIPVCTGRHFKTSVSKGIIIGYLTGSGLKGPVLFFYLHLIAFLCSLIQRYIQPAAVFCQIIAVSCDLGSYYFFSVSQPDNGISGIFQLFCCDFFSIWIRYFYIKTSLCPDGIQNLHFTDIRFFCSVRQKSYCLSFFRIF